MRRRKTIYICPGSDSFKSSSDGMLMVKASINWNLEFFKIESNDLIVIDVGIVRYVILVLVDFSDWVVEDGLNS